MKIAIIGFGAAAIGFIDKLKHTTHEIHVFEKSKDIYSTSISGIRADGKLFVSSEMGGDLEVPLELQKEWVHYYINHTKNPDLVERGASFHNKEYFQQFYKKGFMPILSEFYHIGTDQLKQVLYTIYDDFSNHSNIHFHFNSPIHSVVIKEDAVLLNQDFHFDYLVVAVGRSGHGLVKQITADYPDLICDNTKVDLGVRYEVPNHIVEALNKEMYEFKVKYKSKTGYMVRTFCNNPSGYVVTEHYDNFVTVNGHAKLKDKSMNTNFAILVTVLLTEPFNDPIGYGSHIAEMANLLAGKNRVILQTYDHFCNSKRTKHLYRVQPTLPEQNYILGDINLAFPRRILESIIDFIDNLDLVVPGIGNQDNLVYAPEVKFYSNRINNQHFSHIKFIGDCSGLTRSIIYATAHGVMEAEQVLAR